MASSSQKGRGWLEGTMEVISGMGPRPVTPQSHHGRPASAPNSPARKPARGVFAVPRIERLPSQDSLDRSIHNESGHGKSTAQIIRDLKASNAQLSAKTAAMEAKFMNQLSEATRELQMKHEKQLKEYKQSLAHLEAFKLAADSKLKDKDIQVSKTKEESAFQRHTISDLKNELQQLHTELEEREIEKGEEMDRLFSDNQDMARELLKLQEALKAEEFARQTLTKQLNDLGELPNSEPKMDDMHTSLTEENSNKVLELEEQLRRQSEQFNAIERDLQSQIESLEFTDSQVTVDLREQLGERDDIIAELQSQLDEYADSNNNLNHLLEQTHKDASNQEQYRRDEAEDLRILHDAQEEEITKLRKQLDDAQRELELRDEELEEKDDMILKRDSSNKEEVERLRSELDASQRRMHEADDTIQKAASSLESSEDPGLVRDLRAQLLESRDKVNLLEGQLEKLKLTSSSSMKELESLRKEMEKAEATVIQPSENENETNKLKKELRDSQIALVALDDEKTEMAQKNRELLSAVEKKKEEIQRETKEKLEAKDRENETLRKRLEIFESDLGGENAADPSLRVRLLELDVEELTEERDTILTKLKDRDTTIAALVRSSVSLETRVNSMEGEEVKSVSTDDDRIADQELKELRQAVRVYEEMEPRLQEELMTLKKDLKVAKSDSKRWENALKDDGSTGSEYRYQITTLQKALGEQTDKIEERDRAIENLVNQSISQATHVTELESRISSLLKEADGGRSQRYQFDDTALRAEIRRLNEEGEIFAGQIIEQDEELQMLRRELQAVTLRDSKVDPMSRSLPSSEKQISELQANLLTRDTHIEQLQKELEEAKSVRGTSNSDENEIEALKAELDEYQEANESNRIELRDLRKELRKAKESAGEVNDLRNELAQANYALAEFKRVASTTQGEGASAESNALEEPLNLLRQELLNSEVALERSESAKSKLVTELAEAKAAYNKLEKEGMTTTTDDEKNKSLLKQNDELKIANEDLVKKMMNMTTEVDQHSLDEMRKELDKARSTEKSIVESYERQLSALAIDRDVTVESLLQDLAEARGRGEEGMSEMANQLNTLQSENSGLRGQFEVELQAKNQQIYALEHTLHAQEQILENMRAEMDQLQTSMEYATERKRGEVDDLQQEIMQIEGRAMKQEREINAIKVQFNEKKLEHKAEVARLKEVIATLEKDSSPLVKTVAELQNDDRMLAVRERLEQLKKTNTGLQEENLKLGGRLERATIEIKSFEAEREHAEATEKENSMLRNQVKELEEVLNNLRAQRPPPSPTRTAVDKENPAKSKDTKSKRASKGIGRGLFKRKTQGLRTDEIIQE